MKYKSEKELQQAKEAVHECIKENGGIVKKDQLSKSGIDYKIVIDMLEANELVRIKNGYYTDKLDNFTEEELKLIDEISL